MANKQDMLTINMKQIAGGKASDYVSHILDALCEAAPYKVSFLASLSMVFQVIKSSVALNLTDRQPVNNIVAHQLCNELDTKLILI